MSNVSHLNAPGATRYFVLDADRRPVEVAEAQWRAQSRGERQTVAEDEVPHGQVWTRFSGIALGEGAEKRLFTTESLIGENGLEEASYATWAEAEAGHQRVVEKYRKLFGAADVVSFPGGAD